jgi:hypothetical protein
MVQFAQAFENGRMGGLSRVAHKHWFSHNWLSHNCPFARGVVTIGI